MRHLSLFSGIGGIDLGFDHAGMETVGQVENDPKCVSVLERWWPDVPRWDDVRTFRPDRNSADVVSGGFPCQDVSVAGKRQGLAGSRSGLWWEFHRVLAECRPSWAVVENVPGLLSSNAGRDFAAILGGLGELGYAVVWRVLDARYFGVAQRRRRVFIVGHLGNRPPHEVLDLAQGCCGDSPPSRQAGPAVAALTSCGLGGSGPDDNLAQAGHVIPFQLRGRDGGAMPEVEPDGIAGALRAGDDGSSWQSGQGQLEPDENTVGTLHVGQTPAIAWDALNHAASTMSPTLGQNTGMATGRAGTILADCLIKGAAIGRKPEAGPQWGEILDDGTTFTLQTNAVHTTGVRRLTPVECARLQGFPDNWNDQTVTQLSPAILIGESEARWLCEHAESPTATDPLLTGHSTLVSCTTSDGIGTGLLIYPLDPGTCRAPSVADLAALRVLEDGAVGATRRGGGLATQRNRSGGIVSARPIAKATSTGDDGSCIGSLWKIDLDGLSNAARLFIMSTWTYRTIALRTSGSAPTQNTLRFTTDSIRFVPNSCGGASFGLMLVATRSLSDTHRYRQYGNAVCVNVAEWVGRRIVACEEGQ